MRYNVGCNGIERWRHNWFLSFDIRLMPDGLRDNRRANLF